jgi:hypothetical protein
LGKQKEVRRNVEKNKATWQTKEAECIDILDRHKVKKIWQAIRNIVKKWISKMM